MDNNEIYYKKLDSIHDNLMDITWKLSKLQYKLQENDRKAKKEFIIVLAVNITLLMLISFLNY